MGCDVTQWHDLDGEVKEVDAGARCHDFPVKKFVGGSVFFHGSIKGFKVLLGVVEDYK
jgi:hypothetical protein